MPKLVLVRNVCQLLKLKVNRNSRVTSDLTSSEDPMATVIAVSSSGVIYTPSCVCFYPYKVWMFHCVLKSA